MLMTSREYQAADPSWGHLWFNLEGLFTPWAGVAAPEDHFSKDSFWIVKTTMKNNRNLARVRVSSYPLQHAPWPEKLVRASHLPGPTFHQRKNGSNSPWPPTAVIVVTR